MFLYGKLLLFGTAYSANQSSDLKLLYLKRKQCGIIIASKCHQWLLQSNSAICYWPDIKELWEKSQKFQ